MVKTYKRGFFFGPGLPFGLSRSSAAVEEFLLLPVLGPFKPFFFDSGSGVSSATDVGKGVPFDSDILSTSFALGVPACDAADESCSFGDESEGKLASVLEGRRRMTFLDCFVGFDEFLAFGVDEVIVVVDIVYGIEV